MVTLNEMMKPIGGKLVFSSCLAIYNYYNVTIVMYAWLYIEPLNSMYLWPLWYLLRIMLFYNLIF